MSLHASSEQRPADGLATPKSAGYKNQIRESLRTGHFLYTLEYVPELRSEGVRATDDLIRNATLLGRDTRIAGVNIGDRVKSLDSFDTVGRGRIAADASGKVPLLHLAGKDRTPDEARAVIESALSQGLDNMLLLTGDGIIEQRPQRVPYQESVVAIRDAKRMAPSCLVAAAIAPFKYREEELANQYLKMIKKIHCGADYLITNCGWDMRKLAELAWYRDARGFRTPLVANLLLPTIGWARGIHSRRLPGVFMSDDLYERICEEHGKGKDEAKRMAWNRLALQIVGAQHLGYAGVHLSGVDKYEDLCAAIEMADDLAGKLGSVESWQQAWDEAHRLSGGRTVDFAPPGGLYLFDTKPAPNTLNSLPAFGHAAPSEAERAKYARMDFLHSTFFEKGTPGAAVMGAAVRAMDTNALCRSALLKLEKSTKHATLGCEMCGFCRIEYLLYNCPETCPKGLANGACAGTDENTCEFKDRECIHNRKYRLAKSLGRLEELERTLVPAVEGTRGTSSWINHFKGKTPKVS
jgi:methylenetetrahydrofolate reductase (NADPH)